MSRLLKVIASLVVQFLEFVDPWEELQILLCSSQSIKVCMLWTSLIQFYGNVLRRLSLGKIIVVIVAQVKLIVLELSTVVMNVSHNVSRVLISSSY